MNEADRLCRNGHVIVAVLVEFFSSSQTERERAPDRNRSEWLAFGGIRSAAESHTIL